MVGLRMMQIWSILLWLCLAFGTYTAIRDHQYGPAAIGICVNLAFQYAARKGIRQRQQRLNGTGELNFSERQGRINKALLRTLIPFLIALTISVALFISGSVTPQQEAFIVLGLAIIAVTILTRSLQWVQREHRK